LVVSEALDRLSRDQEDVAALYKRLRFAGVTIVTLAEGEITDLHVGLKGTMNALYLKDLAAKTHRGLRGRVEAGRSAGGRCYGYDVVQERDGAGEPVRGKRRINPGEAAIVRRIFQAYAAGKSPKKIALELNREGVSGPDGGAWGPSTINGNRARGTDLLNNELYVGRLVWNRLRYVKDPETGKRVSRPNPPDQLIHQDVPSCASSTRRSGTAPRRARPT
jgi:site-specific DNA recombinase